MVITERALPRRGCVGIVPAYVRMAMLVFCPSDLEYCIRCGLRTDPFMNIIGQQVMAYLRCISTTTLFLLLYPVDSKGQ